MALDSRGCSLTGEVWLLLIKEIYTGYVKEILIKVSGHFWFFYLSFNAILFVFNRLFGTYLIIFLATN